MGLTNRTVRELPSGMTAGRRGMLIALLSVSSILVIALGMFLLLSDTPVQPALVIGGTLAAIAAFALMIVRHEWLLLLGILAGHSIFYGKFPYQLGMRLKDAAGPGDLLFFLAFVAAIVYWVNQREKPSVPKSLIVAPVLLFLYTAVYVIIAFFFWGRRDNALIQVIGWFYFTVAIPTYLCMSSGKVWRWTFLVLFVSLIMGGILSFFVEAKLMGPIIERTGYGGLGARSFGDFTVRTNQLGMAVMGSLLALVVAAYARGTFWKVVSIVGGMSGALIIFLDRGRATYAGMVAAVVLLLLFLPNAARVRFALRAATALVVSILIVLAIGGPIAEKLGDATEKAANTISLTSEKAIEADAGIAFRARRLRQAEAVWRANPLFGGGPGVTFGQDVDWAAFETTFVTFIDNSWTYPTAVGGLVGMTLILACYACFVGGCLYAYRKLKHPFHRAIAIVPIAQMAWLLVCSPVNWWMVDRYHIAAFSFAVGIVYALVYHEKVNGSEKPVIEVGD